jgi:hypothetical protein
MLIVESLNKSSNHLEPVNVPVIAQATNFRMLIKLAENLIETLQEHVCQFAPLLAGYFTT